MTIPNQNNYPNVKLGYGTGSIKDYGCTLACLSAVSKTPLLELHTMLKGTSLANSAFAGESKNLINWTQLNKYTNGKITHIWRGYAYDQTKITQAINKHGFCLVEVLNSGTKHWIVAIGNRKALDPLTGGEISTSKYPSWTGWSEVVVKETMTQDPLQECLRQHGELVRELDELKPKLEQAEKDRNRYQSERNQARSEVVLLQEEINKLAQSLKDCQNNNASNNTDIPPQIEGWENNGLQVTVGDKTYNYRKK